MSDTREKVKRDTLRTEELPVRLKDNELKEHGQMLASTIEEIAKVEEEKKEVAAAIKERLDGMHKRAAELARVITTGQVNREVEVYDVKNYEIGEMQVVRADTLAVVRSRRLQPDEYQQVLPIDPPEIDDEDRNAIP